MSAEQPAARTPYRHFATAAHAFEAIRQALAWPPDASYEGMFADARKGLNEVIDRYSECDRKRYDVEVENEKLCEAALALYEQVEMDESVGICLSDRTASLNLGDVLGGLR